MKRLRLSVLFFAITGTGAWAQTPPEATATPTPAPTAAPSPSPTAAPAPPAASPVTPAFKLPVRALNIGAEVRHRYEYTDNFDFNEAVTDSDDLVGQRIRLGLEVVATDTVKGYIQIQDSRAFGSAGISPIVGAPVNAVGSGNNTVASQGATTDVHQAYLWTQHKKSGLSLQVGRQEWLYANQKVIGPLGWSNIGRAFDGVRLRHEKKYDTTDVFWSRISEGGRVRAGTAVIDRVDADFYGAYSTLKLIKNYPFDLYALTLSDGEKTAGEAGVTGDTRFHTLGFQLSKVQPVGKLSIEYGTELNYQFGDRSGMDHDAYAVHARLGLGSAKWPLQAKLLYQFDVASGDGDRTDGKSETFQQLFPTVHLWHGYADLVARQNVQDHWVALYTVPAKDWRASLHFHSLKADKGTDALYRASGAVIRMPAPGTDGGTDFGKEIDFIVDRKMNTNWALQAGFCYFDTGSYLKNVPPAGSTSDTGPADKPAFFYLMSTLSF
jgi:hypothetical protein